MNRYLFLGASVLVAAGLWCIVATQSSSQSSSVKNPGERAYASPFEVQARNGNVSNNLSISAPSGNGAEALNNYANAKRCLHYQQSDSAIVEEIASLKTAMAQVAEELRSTVQKEIREKEELLLSRPKCPNMVTSADVSRLLEVAARTGSLEAKLQYADDPAIDPSHVIGDLDALKRWHDSALTYVEDGIKAHDPRAALLLAGASDPFHCRASNEPQCSAMLSHLVSADAGRAYTYFFLSTLFGGEPSWVSTEMSALRRLLTPDEVRQAEERAQALATK